MMAGEEPELVAPSDRHLAEGMFYSDRTARLQPSVPAGR